MMVEATLPDMLKTDLDVSALDRALALMLCRALADPTRLEVMASIWGGERCVCELQESVGGKPQNVVSLTTLRNCGKRGWSRLAVMGSACTTGQRTHFAPRWAKP